MIAGVVVLNAVLGWLQEAKAAQAVAALAKMTTATSAVLRDGAVARVPSAELVKGDVLVLAEGDAVGADARLTQAAALKLLEAPLTGESEAVLKDAALLPGPTALGDRLNMVFKGTAVAQGTGRAIVTATGMQTEMGGIATLLDTTPDAPTPLQVEIAHLGKVLGIAALVIAAVVVATILLISDIHGVADVVTVLLLGVSLAVAAVPEGLPAILSVVLAMGVRRMARHHAIVKKLASVETLGSASVIASDKTGTLTRGEMTVQRVMTASGRSDITGVGYAPEGRAETGRCRTARRPAARRAAGRAARRQPGRQCPTAAGRRRRLGHPGRPDRSRVPGRGAQAWQGGQGRVRARVAGKLRAHRRDPLHLAAQDDVGAGGGPCRRRRACAL